MKKVDLTFWGSMLIVLAVIISQFITGAGSISPALAKSDSGVTKEKIDMLATTAAFPSNFWPTYYSTQSGATGNQSVDLMSMQDQSGADDNPNAYVLFTTPNVIYTGIHLFQLPAGLSSESIQSITLKVNFKGAAVASQKWTWSIYNVANWTWIPIGTNENAIEDTWTLLNFPVTQTGQFVNSTGNILIQLQSDNPTGDAKIDYETLQLTYKDTNPVYTATVAPTLNSPTQTPRPVFTATALPTKIATNTSTPTRSRATPTSTALPTKVATNTPTPTNIPPTRTPTSIPPTPISTALPTKVPTNTPTATKIPPTATPPTNDLGYYVSPTGSDANPGSKTAPWKTIQKAVNTVASGSIVNVLAGNYPEFISTGKSGISFIANGKVTMKGFYLTGSNNRVSGFTITNPASDFGIRVNGNNNIIDNNEISNTKQDGIWFFGSGNKFIGNYIHGIVDRSKITDDPHVDCFQTWGPAENIIFEKNICNHTSTYGSNQIAQISNLNQPVRNITFKNNIFIMHDPGYSPMTFYHMDGQAAISNMYVINNTFVHVNGIGTAAIWFRNITGAYAINNLFIDYGEQNSSYILIEGGADIQISNNAVYKSDNLVPKEGMLPDDIWLSSPEFIDYQNGNFRLKSTSALINKGFNASAWVTDDFDGISRPQDGSFDIGAFEYKKDE